MSQDAARSPPPELVELTMEELDLVAGGLNPQPLPPRESPRDLKLS